MKDKLFSKEVCILMAIGLGINILMVYVTGVTRIPLYLDSIGTILVAALCGTLPGITVGFFSNMINYFAAVSPDPLTLYYGLISVLLAVTVVYQVKKGLFRKMSTTIGSIFLLAFIGGGLGSLLTWVLYGLSFGENVSSNLVLSIYNSMNCSPFVAQFLGDYSLDLVDKGISVAITFLIIKCFSKKMLEKLPGGNRFLGVNDETLQEDTIKCRKISLKWRLTILIVATSMTLGLVATLIGMYIHYSNSVDMVENNCTDIARMIAGLIDGDKIEEYLEAGSCAEDYSRICKEISAVRESLDGIEMVSVFRIENGENRSIFNEKNRDQKEVSYIVWPTEVREQIQAVDAGEGKGEFCKKVNSGESVFALEPIKDGQDKIVAFAAVQMSLKSLRAEENIYFIRIFSLLFGIGILIVAYVFWFYQKSILEPVRILLKQAGEATKQSEPGKRLRDQMQVNTGDELEILFQGMCDAEDNIIKADSASKSKTEFLSKLSHEIRTPLNSVIGFSKLAMDDRKNISREELLDYMQKIQISGNYLLELVSDVLDISRIEEGRMTQVKEAYRLEDLINEVVDSFQAQMKNKQLEFVVDKDYDDVLLYMDEFHTIQILNNLISNAYKYTEEGGVVGFEIHAKKMEKKKMQVQFIVQDTGIGMSEEFQKKIFDPFTQDERGIKMKKQLRGSGLGMSICKNLVDLMGGVIELESTVGEGSCFTVTIIYDLIGNVDESDDKTQEDYSILKGKKILVVDDLELNRIVIEKFLASYGLEFVDAEDGTEAVETFANSAPNEFLTIFMDVQMPEMNGYEATRQIRKLDRVDATIPIIGMTADAFSDDVEKAKQSGMNYHVTKPVQVQKVLNILVEILKGE